MKIEFAEARTFLPGARIKVIGVGGGGGNAINTMVSASLQGVEFISTNTDAKALSSNLAPVRFQLGEGLTRGLGAGAKPEVGREAAMESREAIAELLQGADMVFLTAGMGGGTGTGGAPIIAEVAKEVGALTVAVVTKPFLFEGKKRRLQAEAGIKELKEVVDSLIVIPNQRLLSMASEDTTMLDAFKQADGVLLQAVKGIADLITGVGTINLDFADVRTIMSNRGLALMGVGTANGQVKAVEAAQRAISSPLLDEISITGATGILVNVTGSSALKLLEVNEAVSLIEEEAHEDVNVIFGLVTDDTMGDEVRVTVIATGFQAPEEERVVPPQPPIDRLLKPAQPKISSQVPWANVSAEAADLPVRRGHRPPEALEAVRPLARKTHAASDMESELDLSEFDRPTFIRKLAD